MQKEIATPDENPIVWTQILGFMFASMPAGIKLLRHQKYAKMLVNPLGAFSHTLAHQKNSGTLFCS